MQKCCTVYYGTQHKIKNLTFNVKDAKKKKFDLHYSDIQHNKSNKNVTQSITPLGITIKVRPTV
jgi:hypothetical protein